MSEDPSAGADGTVVSRSGAIPTHRLDAATGPMRISGHSSHEAPRMAATQAFLSRAFGWGFNDYGPDYQELRDAGVDGGIAAGPVAPRGSRHEGLGVRVSA